MIGDFYFTSPQLLWLLPVLLIPGLIYLILRARKKSLVASRLAVLSLIIIAAANPYTVTTQTVRSEQPSITLLDDKTGSMSIFDAGVAVRLGQILNGAQIRSFSGDSTPLGDKILQYSTPGNALVLVSDGQNNKGRPLSNALTLAKASNTTVFAIQISPVKGDSGIVIQGTNTAVIGDDYPFKVVINSSDRYEGQLSVYADDARIYSDNIAVNKTISIGISHTFRDTGTHTLRASIVPDSQAINDEYQKAVYVVPKPSVLLVTSTPSPLASVLAGLYGLSMATDLPADLSGYKAVVLDNQKYSPELDQLKAYVRDGGGLVVVGGPASYEYGGYYNTTFESALPTKSTPSIFEGGKTAVMVMDISYSLTDTRTKDGTPLLDYEKALAIELLKSPDLQDYKVGLVAFGTKAYDVSDPVPLSSGRTFLADRIASLAPSSTENTYLDGGLDLAWNMLNESGSKGELIVLSDGILQNYPKVIDHSVRIIKQMGVTTRLIQVQAFPDTTGLFGKMAVEAGAEFYAFTYPESISTKITGQPINKPEETKQLKGFPIAIVNTDHYITSGLEINATITGFNDITPKPGAQKLVSMADGKPVLTTWRYGLGRVASLSADDGIAWSSSLYSPPASKLISAMVNWAIGDPRPEENRIDADDGWLGTPLQITITSNSRPSIDGATIEKIGDTRYIATFTPDKSGIYYIGDYGIAVNYPLEYRDIGFNPDLPRLIMANGGKVFTEAEARQSLEAEAGRLSQRTIEDRASRRDILLLAAISIFIAEVVLRKLGEIKRRGRSRKRQFL
ncbi:MAG: hypothetical protein ACE14P_04000 [Methanotrichaceae archaeon]